MTNEEERNNKTQDLAMDSKIIQWRRILTSTRQKGIIDFIKYNACQSKNFLTS